MEPEDPDWDDNPEWTEADFAAARPASDLHPELVSLVVRPRGRPPLAASRRKRQVTLRLSPDVLDALRATGPGWQIRVDEILRKAVSG